MTEKTLDVTSNADLLQKVGDVKIVGEGLWVVLCKASSESQGWMKSTKAMQIPGEGILVRVTTQQKNPDGSYAIAEALTWVPYLALEATTNGGHRLVYRILTDVEPNLLCEQTGQGTATVQTSSTTCFSGRTIAIGAGVDTQGAVSST